MKLCLVAPGIMPIPPTRWGAVEMMLWDYLQILSQFPGVDVEILNTPDFSEILARVHGGKFDIVHIHYDVFVGLANQIKGPKIVMSSHYPFISESSRHAHDGYDRLLPQLVDNKNFSIFASSHRDIKTFVEAGAISQKVLLSRLGIRSEQYEFDESPTHDMTFCFSQIVDRKRQSHIQRLSDVVFSGRIDDPNFYAPVHYLGELERKQLNQQITKFANFVLLSKTENTTPLAVKEAMVCGLGVVLSEDAAVELDQNLPFITVLSEAQIQDIEHVKRAIASNREVSKHMRGEIREYAISKFELSNILHNEYIPNLKRVLEQ